jgi:proteasome lid subunit RPN8/RPN11
VKAPLFKTTLDMKTNNKNKNTMKITSSAYTDMVNYIGSRPAESGGAFFGYEEDNVIRHFVADINAKTTLASYTMDTPFLNQKIKEEWEKRRRSLLGIVHAHPYGHPNLSNPDKKYFEDLLKHMSRVKFYTPIIFTIPDGGLKVFPYVYEKGSSTPKAVELEIVSDDYKVVKEVKPPKESKSTTKTTNSFVLVIPQDKEKQPDVPNRTKEILMVVLTIAIIYSTVFFATLQIIPVIIQSFLKIITLWN